MHGEMGPEEKLVSRRAAPPPVHAELELVIGGPDELACGAAELRVFGPRQAAVGAERAWRGLGERGRPWTRRTARLFA
jgi:hypothetical protein